MAFEKFESPRNLTEITMSINIHAGSSMGRLRIRWGRNLAPTVPNQIDIHFGTDEDYGQIRITKGNTYKMNRSNRGKDAILTISGICAKDVEAVSSISCEFTYEGDGAYLIKIPEPVLQYLEIELLLQRARETLAFMDTCKGEDQDDDT